MKQKHLLCFFCKNSLESRGPEVFCNIEEAISKDTCS